MEIKLTKEESENIFFRAMCNTMGFEEMGYYGLTLEYNQKNYDQTKLDLISLKLDSAFEDVLMEMLRKGDKITLIDEEGGGEYTETITLDRIHERVEKTPIRHLVSMLNEEDDVTTADVIIQTVFYNDIIFG